MVKPNIVVITVDCFRSDYFFGKGKAETPFFGFLQKQCTCFSQTVSVSSSTTPAIVSILTGVYPYRHGVKSTDCKFKGTKNIAGAFREAGYYSVAEVVGLPFEKVEMDREFDELNRREMNETIYSEWLEKFSEKLEFLPRPFFMLLHLWELHRPRYMAREFNKPAYGKIAYERSLSCFSFYLEKLLRLFDSETIVVIVGDHGEKLPQNKLQEYFNHGCVVYFDLLRRLGLTVKGSERESHGFGLEDELVLVPLLFKGEPFSKGLIVRQQVSQVDIAPTLLEVAGLKQIEGVDGRSLMPLVREEECCEFPVLMEVCGLKVWPKDKLMAIRTSDWKYLKAPDGKSFFVRMEKDLGDSTVCEEKEIQAPS